MGSTAQWEHEDNRGNKKWKGEAKERRLGSTRWQRWTQSKSTALEEGLESRPRAAALAVAAGWCWMG